VRPRITISADLKLLPRGLSRRGHVPTCELLIKTLFDRRNLQLFRGQADEGWPLETRLHRTFPAQTLAHERRMMQVLQADAPMKMRGVDLPDGELQWMAFSQHHGGPTRLLDWSDSPFVALFFAAIDEPKEDGAIWMLNRSWALRESLDIIRRETGDSVAWMTPIGTLVQTVEAASVPVILPVSPSPRFPRMAAQSGHFTYVGGETASMTLALAACSPHDPSVKSATRTVLEKLTFPASIKEECLQYLSTMQIDYSTIYPDFEGLARSLPRRNWLDWH